MSGFDGNKKFIVCYRFQTHNGNSIEYPRFTSSFEKVNKKHVPWQGET